MGILGIKEKIRKIEQGLTALEELGVQTPEDWERCRHIESWIELIREYENPAIDKWADEFDRRLEIVWSMAEEEE